MIILAIVKARAPLKDRFAQLELLRSGDHVNTIEWHTNDRQTPPQCSAEEKAWPAGRKRSTLSQSMKRIFSPGSAIGRGPIRNNASWLRVASRHAKRRTCAAL